jgi:undecaprenyl diphosphate synthase
MSDLSSLIPQHIAIICDGNRRWARTKGWPVFKGHEFAVKNTIENLIDAASDMGVRYLTFWIFSTENWDRSKDEVEGLMNLFRYMFDQKIQQLHEKNYVIKLIGNRSGLAPDIQERIEKGEHLTANNTGMTVIFAMNYGGHDELRRTMISIAEDVKAGRIKPEEINDNLIESHLDTAGVPNPDMIVRTSGELRLSGFMSWQSQYAEFFFPKFAFPEFNSEKLAELIKEYQGRQRRFGR